MPVRTQIRAAGTYKLTTWFSTDHLHGHDHFGVTPRFGGNPVLLGTMKRHTSHF